MVPPRGRWRGATSFGEEHRHGGHESDTVDVGTVPAHVLRRRADQMGSKLHVHAAIFDLDGVVTDTARLHTIAWKTLLDAYLERRTAEHGESHRPFHPVADYRSHVDGRPRYEGLQAFLVSRGIELPWGDPSDSPDRETVCGLGNRKQEIFEEVLRNEEPDRIEGTVRLIEELRERGTRVAVASSSRNCRRIVEGAGLAHLFEARVDGETLAELGLPGKPDPAMFLEAARRLEALPSKCVVFEDAESGVEAGRSGRFGLVVGVAADPAARLPLREAGADLVWDVGEMDTLPVRLLDAWFGQAEHRRPNALARWPRLVEELGSRRPAVFLDYDGTLTPIVSRPEEAKIPSETREVVRRIAERFPTTVVSGRGREDVAALVGLESINVAGSHGFDISGPDGAEQRIRHEAAAEVEPVIEELARGLQDRIGGVEGVVIEPKRFTLAVHYRLVSDRDLPVVEEAVDAALRDHPELRKAHGKKVFELRPDLDWDKGRAILWLLDALDLDDPGTVPIYLGDDTTDEDAFRALRGRGVGIVVTPAPRPTEAEYSLQDPGEVRAFLERLAALGPAPPEEP
jgi:trehalose-phosphatase